MSNMSRKFSISAGVETLFIGRNQIHLSETASTNNYAAEMLRQVGTPEGTVVTANYQSSGRGQRSKPARCPGNCALPAAAGPGRQIHGFIGVSLGGGRGEAHRPPYNLTSLSRSDSSPSCLTSTCYAKTFRA